MMKSSVHPSLLRNCVLIACSFALNGCDATEEADSGAGSSEGDDLAAHESELTDSPALDAAIRDVEDNERLPPGCDTMCPSTSCSDTCFFNGNTTTCLESGFPCQLDPPEETFCSLFGGEYVSLSAQDDGAYVALDDDNVSVEKHYFYSSASKWKVSCHGNRVAFKNNGRYLRASNDWDWWIDTQSFVGAWEKWSAYDQTDGRWRFKSDHGRYLEKVGSGFRAKKTTPAGTAMTFDITER